MTITDRILSSSDRLKLLAAEKLKLPATLLITGISIAGASFIGLNAAELLATHIMQDDVANQIYNAMYGAVAGSVLGYAISHFSIKKIASKVRSLVEPVDGNINRISAERLYKNFVDITMHSKHKDVYEKDLINRVASTATEHKISEINEFLSEQTDPQAKKMSSKLNDAYATKFAGKLLKIASQAEAKQTGLGLKVQRSSQSLGEFIAKTGLDQIKSKAYVKTLEDIKEMQPLIKPIDIMEALAADVVSTLPKEAINGIRIELMQSAPAPLVEDALESIEMLSQRKEPMLGSVYDISIEDRGARQTPQLCL